MKSSIYLKQIATDYADAIARSLQEYQTGIPVPIGANPDQIYTDLAWGGLQEAPIFDVKFPANSSDRERIVNRY